MKNNQIDFNIFLEYFEMFFKIPTWTKEKYDLQNKMLNIISKKNTHNINIHCHSNNCITKDSNYFIFIKIDNRRRRFFKPFQNKWVMIYSIRDRFYMNYTINILPKDFNPKEIISIANSIGFKNINEHIKIDNYTTNNI